MLALVTAACWATLPVALKFTLQSLDVYTLTWFRFLVATAVIAAWLQWRGGYARFGALGRRHWALLALAAVMLIGNYLLYLAGLHLTTPATAQLLIQLAPLLMALGGVLVFGERFGAGQWFGMALLVLGLWLFFADQLEAQGRGSRYLTGGAVVIAAAVVWAVYSLAQKQLLTRLSSPAILGFIYLVASVVLLPLSRPASLLQLDLAHWIALLYCALNTLIAYGAFAEALAHWEASRVSVILASTPLLTVLTVSLVHGWVPGAIAPERIGLAGLVGALLVVAGSAAASLLGYRASRA